MKFVWRQLEFAFFGALTSVGALFVLTENNLSLGEKEMKKTLKLILLASLALLMCALMFTACDSGQKPTDTNDNTSDGTSNGSTNNSDNKNEDAHIHAFDAWTTVKEATCTVEGSKERYCSCGEKQTASISAGHTWSNWTTTKEATCTENGEETRVCPCGEEENRIIVASHAWQNATCIAAKTCTKCGSTEGTALGHTAATGRCSRCNEEIMPHITLPNTPISTSVTFSSERTTMKITNITYEFDGNKLVFYYTGEKTYDNISAYNGKYFCGFSYKLYDADDYVIASGTASVRDISVGDKFRNEDFKIYDVAPSTSYRLVIEDYK